MNYDDYKKVNKYNPDDFSKNYKIGKRFKDYHPPKLTEDNILDRIKDLSQRIDDDYSSPYSSKQNVSSTEIIKLLNYVHDLIVKLRGNYDALSSLNQEDQINITVGDEEIIVDGDLATDVIHYAVKTYVQEALTAAVEIDKEIDNFHD